MKAIIALLCLFLSLGTNAQVLTGKVIDGESQPVAFSNIILMDKDSVFITGDISGEDGTFRIARDARASLVKISYVGYMEQILPVGSNDDMGIIRLQEENTMLGEVEIKGSLPVTRLKGDAMVTTVENTVLSSLGSANDVLLKIPGLTKNDDSFEVFGKGEPLIYINGREIRNKNELETLNSDEIKSVELVTNPGARYDATVKAVVRIQTVRRKGEGFGFDVRSSYYQSINTDLIETINLNYQHCSWDFFGNVNYYHYEMSYGENAEQENDYGDVLTQENNINTTSRMNYIEGTAGFNFMPKEGHSLGMRYDVGSNLSYDLLLETTSDVLLNGIIDDHLLTNTRSDYSGDITHDLNAYYNGKVGDASIEFNADYYKETAENQSDTEELSSEHDDRVVRSANPVNNQLAAGKLVVTIPFGENEISFGTEYTYTRRTDDNLSYAEEFVPTSYSKFKEHNIAAFVEYNRSLPFGQLSAGVRYEHDDFKYFEDGEFLADQSRTYDNFFPNASFSTQIGNSRLQLSYASKTNRPYYSLISNNILYLNRFTYRQGNPSLKPSLDHGITFNGSWRFINATVSYIRKRDAIIDWARRMDGSPEITILGCENMDKTGYISALLSASPTIGCWSPTLSVGVRKSWLAVEINGEQMKFNRPGAVASFYNAVKLPWGVTLNADVDFTGKYATSTFYSERNLFLCNVSVRKSFFDDNFSVELRGTDLFKDRKFYNVGYMNHLKVSSTSYSNDSREFVLTLRYKFNTSPSKYKGTGAGNEQKNRL